MSQKILIYDDEKEILQVITIILEQRGYNVLTRPNVNNITEDIRLEQPVLILMDLSIPDGGGENAIRGIKSNWQTSHIPVMLFSASNAVVEIAARSGANGYLKKPFDIGELVRLIKETIGEKPA